MKRYWLIIGFTLAFVGCSTQKNTGASRSFHQTTTRYNIYFNGHNAYQEGLNTIDRANTDDYSTILTLYPVSNHRAAEASKSQMDQAIEKCRKCIKLHSIHAKPKLDPKRRNDPAYKQWLTQKEFNNQMWRAWMLLGQAEFHQGQFLESVGTFNYVSRLYETDKNIVAMCQLWVARAYGEMGWIYEAEDIVAKVKVDDLSRKNLPFYSAVSADLALKAERYHDAIAFVKIARDNEQKKQYRPRFEFVLGELYEKDGQVSSAIAAYKRVNKLHPKDVELDFNAEVRVAELSSDTTRALRQLRKLARLYKNKDRLDHLYGAIGNVYLSHKDTVSALNAYEKAITESTQNSSHKAAALLTAGDLYYGRRAYAEAAPCYSEAAQLLDHNHPSYARVEKRNAILGDLVTETQMVELQDSLQHLATLSEEEQLKVVEQLIADLIEQEKQDSLAAAALAREQELEAESGGRKSVNTLNMLGGSSGDNNWYFYNAQLVKQGRQEFMRKWGNRPNEDNWRRKSKATMSSFREPELAEEAFDEEIQTDSLRTDSLSTDSVLMEVVSSSDPHEPQYYLQQIPRTETDFEASNQQIADALYRLVGLYRDRVENEGLARETFADFLRRFPQEERRLELYYRQYIAALKGSDALMADSCRKIIMNDFPDSQEAAIVSDPNYAEKMRKMAVEQDSLYQATYAAYTHAQFADVKANKRYAEATYPMSPLMPQFLFLNAVAVAKTEGQESFVAELKDMVQRCPTSELGAIAKDMLAMMGEGLESQQGESVSSLADKRGAIETEEDSLSAEVIFSAERKDRAMVVLSIAQDEEVANELLYEVALFNFSQFLIKDFDIRAVPLFMVTKSAIQISGFDSLDEAEWYLALVEENADLRTTLETYQVQKIAITETNYALLGRPFSIEDYLQFIRTE